MNIPSHKSITKALAHIGLGVGIIISLTIAIQFTTSSVFPEIDRSDYCPDYRELNDASDESQCTAVGGVWSEGGESVVQPAFYDERGPIVHELSIEPYKTSSQCNEDYNCQDVWQEAQQNNKTRQFILSFALSFTAFILGAFVLVGTSASALVWTGVISMLVSLRFVPNDKDILIAIATAVIAIVLILMLAKKQKENK